MSSIPLELLQSLTGRLLTLGLFHSIWTGLLAASLVAIVFQALPRLSHRTRYRLLLLAVGAVVTAPIFAVGFQRMVVTPKPNAPGTSIAVRILPGERKPPEVFEAARSAQYIPSVGEGRSSQLLGDSFKIALDSLESIQPFFIVVWLIGTTVLLGRLLLAGLAISRLTRSAAPASTKIQAQATDLARRLGLRNTPPVLVQPILNEPGLCGLFRPKILLPIAFLDASDPERIEAILAHELAHAKRLDLPANLMQRIVETALFFHPAVHWLSRALRSERELCADALAVTLTGDPISLASALESVARLRLASLNSGLRAPTFGASLGGESVSLLPRIQELLGMTPTHPTRRSFWPWASLPVAGLVALLATSPGLAEDRPKGALLNHSSSKPKPTTAVPSTARSTYAEPSSSVAIGIDGNPSTSNNRISYKLRLISTNNSAWRNKLAADHITELHREGKISVWMVPDPKSTNDLITSILSDRDSGMIEMPTLVSFVEARAIFTIPSKQDWLTDVLKPSYPDAKASEANLSNVEIASQVDLNGKVLPSAVQMNVNHYATSLVAIDGRVSPASHDPSSKTAKNQQKQPVERPNPRLLTKHFQVSKVVAEGASLLIGLGKPGDRP